MKLTYALTDDPLKPGRKKIIPVVAETGEHIEDVTCVSVDEDYEGAGNDFRSRPTKLTFTVYLLDGPYEGDGP